MPRLPVTRLFVEEIILECRQKHITKVDLLGFEFEMGLFPNVLAEAKSKGIDIQPKYTEKYANYLNLGVTTSIRLRTPCGTILFLSMKKASRNTGPFHSLRWSSHFAIGE